MMQVAVYNPGGISVEVIGNPAPPTGNTSADADFAARVASPGVLRWFHFNDPSQLGVMAGSGPPPNFGTVAGTATNPRIDNTVFASGTGSLLMELPRFSDQSGAGAWFANFSPDLQTQFGAGGHFFIQFRLRWNKAICDTVVKQPSGVQTDTKYCIIGAGDQTPGLYPYSPQYPITRADSSGTQGKNTNDIKLVGVSRYAHKCPILYHYWPTGTGTGDQGLFIGLGGGDFNLENAMPNPPGCRYAVEKTVGPSDPIPGCFTYAPDEWMHCQTEIKVGTKAWFTAPDNSQWEIWDGTEVRQWWGNQGKPAQLVYDWTPANAGMSYMAQLTGYKLNGPVPDRSLRFGKIWLLPHQTQRDPAQDTGAVMQAWYDELIISTQRIPDPAA